MPNITINTKSGTTLKLFANEKRAMQATIATANQIAANYPPARAEALAAGDAVAKLLNEVLGDATK